MTEMTPPEKQSHSRLRSLAAALGGLSTRAPAPVQSWHPPFCGDIDMRIAADGSWWYEGTPIARPALVSLLASVLRKDDDRFVLVTPAECVGIQVDDAPFAAVAMEKRGSRLRFVSNVGDEVEADEAHPLRFEISDDGGIKPYVLMRDALWARLTRSLAIELLDRAEDRDGTLAIRSGETWFPLTEQ